MVVHPGKKNLKSEKTDRRLVQDFQENDWRL